VRGEGEGCEGNNMRREGPPPERVGSDAVLYQPPALIIAPTAPGAVLADLRLEAAGVQPVLKHVVGVGAGAPLAAGAAGLGAELGEVRLGWAAGDDLAHVRKGAAVPVVARVVGVVALDDLGAGWVGGVGGVWVLRRGGGGATEVGELSELFVTPAPPAP